MNRLDLGQVPCEAVGSRTSATISHSVVRTWRGVELRRTKTPLYYGIVLVAIGLIALWLCFTVGRKMDLALRIIIPAVFAWGGICFMAFYLASLVMGTRVLFDEHSGTATIWRSARIKTQFPLGELVAVQLCYKYYADEWRYRERFEMNLVRSGAPGEFDRHVVVSNYEEWPVRPVAERLARELGVSLLDCAKPEDRSIIKMEAHRRKGLKWVARKAAILPIFGTLFCFVAATMQEVFKYNYDFKAERLMQQGELIPATIKGKQIFRSGSDFYGGGGHKSYRITYLPDGAKDIEWNWIQEGVSPEDFNRFEVGQRIHAWILGDEHLIQERTGFSKAAPTIVFVSIGTILLAIAVVSFRYSNAGAKSANRTRLDAPPKGVEASRAGSQLFL